MSTKEYGVSLNIHPSVIQKRVMLHRLPCNRYKMHYKKNKGKTGAYTFHKDCKTFEEAIGRVSDWALEWHAPVKACKGCLKNWNLP